MRVGGQPASFDSATPRSPRTVGHNGGVADCAAMERYLSRCLGLIVRLQGVLPPESLDCAQHLMDHGEPAEGVLSLAWALVENEAHVPAAVVRDWS